MAKKKPKLTTDEAVELATLEANVEAQEAAEAAAAEPDLPASVGFVVVKIAPVDPLEQGEVIRDEKEQTLVINGRVHHHIREATDGRWIYIPVRSDG